MKRIIYVLLMMLPVMASAQKSEDSIRQELRNAIVKTFKDVAKKTGEGEYWVDRGIEKYSLNYALFKNKFTFKTADGNEHIIMQNNSDSIKQFENIAYITNEFWNNVYEKFYRYVSKSYNLVQKSKDSYDYDTIRAVLGITPKCDVSTNDLEASFREYFLFDLNKGNGKRPYNHSVSVEYKVSKTDDVPVYYATYDDMAELKGMVSDYIKTLKGYKMKSYSVSYEYSGDYKETKDAMPTFNYFGGSFVGVKTTGKHYVIRMLKEDMQSNSSVFINKMIEKAKVLGAMSLTTEIDPTVKIMDDSQCQDLLLTHTYIWDEEKHTSKFYNVVLGFDEKGLHILEAECNNYVNPIPMMWMNIKTLYNDKVKWEKGLEP